MGPTSRLPGSWQQVNNNNNNKACPVGTRGEVANMWRESVQAQLSISIFLPSARVLRRRAGDSIITKNQKSWFYYRLPQNYSTLYLIFALIRWKHPLATAWLTSQRSPQIRETGTYLPYTTTTSTFRVNLSVPHPTVRWHASPSQTRSPYSTVFCNALSLPLSLTHSLTQWQRVIRHEPRDNTRQLCSSVWHFVNHYKASKEMGAWEAHMPVTPYFQSSWTQWKPLIARLTELPLTWTSSLPVSLITHHHSSHP